MMAPTRIVLSCLLLLSVAACGGYSSPSSPSPTPAPVPAPSPSPAPAPTADGPTYSIAIPSGASVLTTTAFNPDVTDVAVGGTVTWTNNDAVAHTSTSNGTGWNSGTIAPGGQFSFKFQTAGTYQYHCAIHPGMVGTIVVQ